LGLHRHLHEQGHLESKCNVLYYSGGFKKLLRPYANNIFPMEKATKEAIKARNDGTICPDLKEVSRHILTSYKIADVECNTITLLKRSHNRRLINFNKIKSILESIGLPLVVVEPENMDFREELLLYRKTKFIVGAHGAGLANMIFMQSGTFCLELNPYGFYCDFFPTIANIYDITFSEIEGNAPLGYGSRYPKNFALRTNDGPWSREEYSKIENKAMRKTIRRMMRDVPEFTIDMNKFESFIQTLKGQIIT